MTDLLKESRNLMPGRARTHWNLEEAAKYGKPGPVRYMVQAHDAGTIYKAREFKKQNRAKAGDYARELAQKISKLEPKWGWIKITMTRNHPPAANPHGVGKTEEETVAYYSFKGGKWTKHQGKAIKGITSESVNEERAMRSGAVAVSTINPKPRRGRKREKISEEKTQVFNPYGMGMWVIRVEDYLYKLTGKKWTWKKPIISIQGGKKIQYKWVGRKKRGAISPPIFTSTVEYKAGPDSFDIETSYFDGNNIVASKTHHDVYIEQAVDPQVLFGWVRHKWSKKTGMKTESFLSYNEFEEATGSMEFNTALWKKLKARLPMQLSGVQQVSQISRKAHVRKLSIMYKVGSPNNAHVWLRDGYAEIQPGLAKKSKKIYTVKYADADVDGAKDAIAAKLKALQVKGENAPGPFAVSDNPPSIQDMVDDVRAQIKAPSWTYPSWALPKVQLDE